MPPQPTGRVTLLFTDIEGSTRLLGRLGPDRYRETLELHRRLLRRAFDRHGGYEVDYEGDAFFVAFAKADEAVAAAGEAQEVLATADWPDGEGIRVRMGLHTGEPVAAPPKYVGLDVHMAARIMAAAHGGQIVLSSATCSAVAGLAARPLGEHRLKDFDEAVSLFQLGDAEFPPLKTISNTNLPRPASSFVGRGREVAEVVSLLKHGTRLLSLTGAGGSGKTRLAIEAAAELVPTFSGGVSWVGLASARDPGLVLEAIASMLGARGSVVEHIGERELLLLLDNLEQLVDAGPELAALVEGCPNLCLLVTSREVLRVRGEVEYPVPPLSGPEASELFSQRARLSADEVVAELCRRLDNLPLAVELAAARAAVLSPAELLDRLSQRLDLLKGGRDAPARQQTLRATIEWSHDLLTAAEQRLFGRLSVFAGGARLEATEKVTGAHLDTLQSLVQKSLIRRTEGRFWMLETIREYAGERLHASDERDALRRRHAEYFFAFVADVYEARLTIAEEYVRLEPEAANIDAALTWAEERGDAPGLALVVSVLWRLWRRSSRQLQVGLRRAESVLARREELAPDLRLRTLIAASEMWRSSAGGSARARELKLEAIELARQTNTQARAPHGELLLTHTLADLADMDLRAGNLERARIYLQQSLAEGGGARTLASLASLAIADGRLDDAMRYALEAQAGFEAAGHSHNATDGLQVLGDIERRRGNLAAASAYFSRALQGWLALHDETSVGECLDLFARLALDAGDFARAAQLFGAACKTDPVVAGESSIPLSLRQTFAPDMVEAGGTMTLDQAVVYALQPEPVLSA